uniref:Uncharacterized protein n=1 Tax=Anopheles minimus TaxID=112268 RepID=A0A182WPB7_9DIPT
MLAALYSEYQQQQNLDAEVPGPSRMVSRNSDSTSQGENQPQEMEELANPIDTLFGEFNFNFTGGGAEEDVVVETLDFSNTVDVDGVGYIDPDCIVETEDEDDHESGISVDSEDEDEIGESTAAHVCKNHSSIGDCLRDWAVVHNQPRSSVNEILAIFRKWTELPLPKDSRTLLKTSSTIG